MCRSHKCSMRSAFLMARKGRKDMGWFILLLYIAQANGLLIPGGVWVAAWILTGIVLLGGMCKCAKK